MRRPARRWRAAPAALAWVVACGAAGAQDAFPSRLPGVPGAGAAAGTARSATPPPEAAPATGPRSATPVEPKPAPATAARPPAGTDPSRADAGELPDFGVPPTAQLRPSNALHGPTPTSIPGARVVSTRQLAEWTRGQPGPQGRVMLLHAIGGATHLPNAIPAAPASQGGAFDDAVQREFGDYLRTATGGDRATLIVTYCQGVQCWGSYNAALRAVRLGYTNVHWYRGGMDAWRGAGLPLVGAGR